MKCVKNLQILKGHKQMKKKLVYSDLKEIVYTVYESEIQEAVLKLIGETDYIGLTFVYNYDEDGAVTGATVTFHRKHVTKEEIKESCQSSDMYNMQLFSKEKNKGKEQNGGWNKEKRVCKHEGGKRNE